MSSRKHAEREAFRAVDETCPHVDAAMSAATEVVKSQTTALRNALVDAIAERMEAEDQLADAEKEISELKARVADLESQLDTALAGAELVSA